MSAWVKDGVSGMIQAYYALVVISYIFRKLKYFELIKYGRAALVLKLVVPLLPYLSELLHLPLLPLPLLDLVQKHA